MYNFKNLFLLIDRHLNSFSIVSNSLFYCQVNVNVTVVTFGQDLLQRLDFFVFDVKVQSPPIVFSHLKKQAPSQLKR
jgi:hypothetical protein